MENRKPYELKNLLIAYNFLQVLFSAWLFYEVRYLSILLPISFQNVFVAIYHIK